METELAVMQARNGGSYKKSKRPGKMFSESLHREDSPVASFDFGRLASKTVRINFKLLCAT